jgi:hypothetical protein
MYDLLFPFANWIGMFGVILTLIAYLLLSVGHWRSHSFIYQILNLVGAICILFSLFFHWNVSSVVMEIAWSSISLIGLLRLVFSPNKTTEPLIKP